MTTNQHLAKLKIQITFIHKQHLYCVHLYFALQVFSNQFFLVQMDDMREETDKKGGSRLFVCHRDSPGIFPAQWSFKNGVKLSPPPGITLHFWHLISFMLVLGVVVASGVFCPEPYTGGRTVALEQSLVEHQIILLHVQGCH